MPTGMVQWPIRDLDYAIPPFGFIQHRVAFTRWLERATGPTTRARACPLRAGVAILGVSLVAYAPTGTGAGARAVTYVGTRARVAVITAGVAGREILIALTRSVARAIRPADFRIVVACDPGAFAATGAVASVCVGANFPIHAFGLGARILLIALARPVTVSVDVAYVGVIIGAVDVRARAASRAIAFVVVGTGVSVVATGLTPRIGCGAAVASVAGSIRATSLHVVFA